MTSNLKHKINLRRSNRLEQPNKEKNIETNLSNFFSKNKSDDNQINVEATCSSEKKKNFKKLKINHSYSENNHNFNILKNDDKKFSEIFHFDDNPNIFDVKNYNEFVSLEKKNLENNEDDSLINVNEIINKPQKLKNSKKFVKKKKVNNLTLTVNLKKLNENDLNDVKVLPDCFTEETIIVNNEFYEDESTIIDSNLNDNFCESSTSKKKIVDFKDFFKNNKISNSNSKEDISIQKKAKTNEEKLPKKRGRKPKIKNVDNECKKIIDSVKILDSIKIDSNIKTDDVIIEEVTEINLTNDDSFIEIKENNWKTDFPWVVKYKPISSNHLLNNISAANTIKNWINDFIMKKNDNVNFEENSFDILESCVLVYGPTGSGKTSMVYAIAEELNFKVFELNCSSRRNGKIINKIKETTLSHTVSRQSDNFNNTLKTPDLQQRNFLNFFKKKTVESKSNCLEDSSLSQETSINLNSLSINSNSLILFDDVDVIFEEDTGFWASLNFLLEITKRPIIFTSTKQLEIIKQEVKNILCIEINYPCKNKIRNYLEKIVIKECYSDDSTADILNEHKNKITSIIEKGNGDIRSSLNKLQFDFSFENVLTNSNVVEPINTHNESIILSENTSLETSCLSSKSDDKVEEKIDIKYYNNLMFSDIFSTNFQIESNNFLVKKNVTFKKELDFSLNQLSNNILTEFNNSFQSTYFNNLKPTDSNFKSSDVYNYNSLENNSLEVIELDNFELPALNNLELPSFNDFKIPQLKDIKPSTTIKLESSKPKEVFELSSFNLPEFKFDEINWKKKLKKCTSELYNNFKLSVNQNLYYEYLSFLSSIVKLEDDRLILFIKNTRRSKRFLHHLDNIGFNISDFTKNFLLKEYFFNLES